MESYYKKARRVRLLVGTGLLTVGGGTTAYGLFTGNLGSGIGGGLIAAAGAEWLYQAHKIRKSAQVARLKHSREQADEEAFEAKGSIRNGVLVYPENLVERAKEEMLDAKKRK